MAHITRKTQHQNRHFYANAVCLTPARSIPRRWESRNA